MRTQKAAELKAAMGPPWREEKQPETEAWGGPPTREPMQRFSVLTTPARTKAGSLGRATRLYVTCENRLTR